MVIFDVGGTLIEPYPPVGEVYSAAGEKYGMHADPAEIQCIFGDMLAMHERQAALIASGDEKAWWSGFVSSVMGQAAGRLANFNDFFEEVYEHFEYRDSWRFFPETEEVLEALRSKGFRMAVASNWDSRLIALCKDMGIDKYFEFMVVSALVGVAKPDPGIFRIVLQKAGLSSEEALYVGDNLENDGYGARNAGIPAVIIDRRDRVKTDFCPVVRSLKGIFQYLK